MSPRISASFFSYSARAGRFFSSSAQIAAAGSSLFSGSRTAMRVSACLSLVPRWNRCPRSAAAARRRTRLTSRKARADCSRDPDICARSQAFRHKPRWRRSMRRRLARRSIDDRAPCSCAPSSDAPCSCAPERRALQLRLIERRALQLRPNERRALQLRARRATRPEAAPRRAARPEAAPSERRALQLRPVERRALQLRAIEDAPELRPDSGAL